MNPLIAGNRLRHQRCLVAFHVHEALNDIGEGHFAFVNRPACVQVNLGHGPHPAFLLGASQWEIGAAHQRKDIVIRRLSIARKCQGESMVPGIGRQTEDVGRSAVDGCLQIFRLAEDLELDRFIRNQMFLGIGRQIGHAERIHVRRDRNEIMAQISQIYTHTLVP